MAPLVGSGLWFGSSSRGFGVFALGNGAPTTNIFTYANAAVAASTNLTANLYAGAATGNSTEGVFAIGNITPTTNIFTYANAAVAASTNLTANLYAGTATSASPGGF